MPLNFNVSKRVQHRIAAYSSGLAFPGLQALDNAASSVGIDYINLPAVLQAMQDGNLFAWAGVVVVGWIAGKITTNLLHQQDDENNELRIDEVSDLLSNLHRDEIGNQEPDLYSSDDDTQDVILRASKRADEIRGK